MVTPACVCGRPAGEGLRVSLTDCVCSVDNATAQCCCFQYLLHVFGAQSHRSHIRGGVPLPHRTLRQGLTENSGIVLQGRLSAGGFVLRPCAYCWLPVSWWLQFVWSCCPCSFHVSCFPPPCSSQCKQTSLARMVVYALRGYFLVSFCSLRSPVPAVMHVTLTMAQWLPVSIGSPANRLLLGEVPAGLAAQRD
jgi:hypothetical protein